MTLLKVPEPFDHSDWIFELDPWLLSTLAGRWKTSEAGVDRLHAEAAHDSQRHGENRHSLAIDVSHDRLTFKTVANARKPQAMALRFIAPRYLFHGETRTHVVEPFPFVNGNQVRIAACIGFL
jgi:hypothetical protein